MNIINTEYEVEDGYYHEGKKIEKTSLVSKNEWR